MILLGVLHSQGTVKLTNKAMRSMILGAKKLSIGLIRGGNFNYLKYFHQWHNPVLNSITFITISEKTLKILLVTK